MTYDDDAVLVRTRLEDVAGHAPGVGFTPAEVIRRGRRRRAVRRGAVAGGAVVAVALAIGVPATLLRTSAPDRITTITADAPTPTGSPAPSSPASTTPAGVGADGLPVPGPIPGVPAAEARSIARDCGQAYGGDIGHVNPTPDPGETSGPLVRDAVRVYNVVRDAAGMHALLYGPGVQLSCDVAGNRFSSGGQSGDDVAMPYLLPGAVSIDNDSGGATTAGAHYAVVEGRVAPGVVRVDVRLAGERILAAAVNGTYIARFVGATPESSAPPSRVTAYDAAGRVVGTAQPQTGCYTDPGGRVVIHDRAGDRNCRPATPWH
jgi:hypothetical protein